MCRNALDSVMFIFVPLMISYNTRGRIYDEVCSAGFRQLGYGRRKSKEERNRFQTLHDIRMSNVSTFFFLKNNYLLI